MTDQTTIDLKRFNNNAYIEERVIAADLADRGSVKTALRYLYLDDGPINLPRDRQKIAEKYLEDAERILIRWLATRTNGSERKNYGSRALITARSTRYRCQQCGFSDVRCLNLDHIDGRVDGTEFACLCANCHTIKSRQKDWSGKALRQKDVEEQTHYES
jgi:hypothetical protein